MYIERCKHGSGRGLYKPAAEMREGGTFLLYFKFKKALEEGKSREEALALSKKPWGKKNNGGDAA